MRYESILEVNQDVYTWLDETESTMVSVRFLAYSLGLPVTWCQETLTAVVDPYGLKLSFTYQQTHMYKNGTPVPLTNVHGELVPTYLISNRLFVPLRPVGLTLDMPVDWNVETRTAYLYITNGSPEECDCFAMEVVSIPIKSENVYMTQRITESGVPELVHLFKVNSRPGWITEETESPMVPIRFVAYVLGLDIEWCAQTRTATIDPNGHDIRFTYGQSYMRRNGYYMPIRSINGEFIPAAILEDHMFVTPRALGEALSFPVGWNANTQTAYLYVVPLVQ
jgi:hypothetical protein